MAYVSLDSDQIKKAHKKPKYSKTQVEQLEKCMDPKSGPLYFMKQFMKIQHPVKGSIPFQPFPYQERLIESYNDHRYTAVPTSHTQGFRLKTTSWYRRKIK